MLHLYWARRNFLIESIRLLGQWKFNGNCRGCSCCETIKLMNPSSMADCIRLKGSMSFNSHSIKNMLFQNISDFLWLNLFGLRGFQLTTLFIVVWPLWIGLKLSINLQKKVFMYQQFAGFAMSLTKLTNICFLNAASLITCWRMWCLQGIFFCSPLTWSKFLHILLLWNTRLYLGYVSWPSLFLFMWFGVKGMLEYSIIWDPLRRY